VASLSDWLSAARPRTLPAAVAPVLVGTGAADALGSFNSVRALLCLLVSLSLQIGVNFANDYSDGVRGTDAVRVGPTRMTASGGARASTVKRVAFAFFALAGAAGIVLALQTEPWLILVGAASILAAWFYTGGPRPYGYAGFGEVFVFTFFGLVAVLGTTYVQALTASVTAVAAAIGIGLLACALLVANNLRDVQTDAAVGKRTLAVILGAPVSRRIFALMIVVAFLAIVVVGIAHPTCLLALLAAPLAVEPIRQTLAGATGRDLITVLGATGRLELAYAVTLTIGLFLA
jgi:1,4-dihydroxy-2-naphthoate octaprenyltransferase